MEHRGSSYLGLNYLLIRMLMYTPYTPYNVQRTWDRPREGSIVTLAYMLHVGL